MPRATQAERYQGKSSGMSIAFATPSKISSLSRVVNLGPEKKLSEGSLISKLQAASRT